MTKDELEAFCENQTLSQEDWFKYNGEIYFIQGFYISQENKMCLTLDNIASNKEVWINKVDYQEDDTQETNVKEFLKPPCSLVKHSWRSIQR